MKKLIILIFLNTSIAAAANDVYGIFMVVKGDVKISKANSKDSVAVKVGAKVLPGDWIISAADSRAKVVMSDRNVINISPDTKLELTKYENDGVTKNVEMKLLQGKVRNNVEQKYDDDKNKFMIKTPTAVAGVRGTQFFTSFDPVTKVTSIVTIRGAVSFAALSVNGVPSTPVIVNKGESTSMSVGNNPEAPKPLPKEELKKIDQESTASSGSKPDGSTKVALDKQTKQENKKDPNAPSDIKPGSASSETNRAPSSEPAPKIHEPPKLADRTDLDSSQFREIRVPSADNGRPPPPNVLTPNLPPPPPTDLINDIVRGTLGRGKLIITPQ